MTPSTPPRPSASPPEHLLGLLHRVTIISSLLILSLSATGIYWVYERYVIKNAEAEAVNISQSIVALEQHWMLQPGSELGGGILQLDEIQMARFDIAIRKYLEPYNILKIKIFNLQGEIVYSTDRQLTGQRDATNQRLARALAGFNDSELSTKGRIKDLQDEQRIDVDVVETYVPIRNEAGRVVGSFELYQDTTVYRDDVVGGVVLSVLILTTILALVFSIAYLFLRTAVKRLSQAQHELKLLATLDGLTGLVNHREIVRIGKNEFSRYSRQPTEQRVSFSLIMADVDHFKLINDSYGHMVGDEVLRVVAQRMQEQMRSYSVVGRYGGEEFLMILPETGLQEAQAVAERVRVAIETRPVVLAELAVPVTLSLGVASIGPEDSEFEALLQRTDQALYHAKRGGRNLVSDGA